MPINANVLLVLVCSAAALAADRPPSRLYNVAKARAYPAGGPKAGDVIMRSLRLHPTGPRDAYDTMRALSDFHVTRLEWTYVDKADFIKKVRASGRVFGGAASAPSYLPSGKDTSWFEKVVIVDAKGRPIIAPWKRTWKRTLWGCVNNPELERGYVEYLKRYVDAGAQVMQRDEPEANRLAVNWGGCFCRHCMEGFRRHLAEHTDRDQRHRLGIDDLAMFDYGKYLLAKGAPVGDAFGKWKGGELKKLFVDFQADATVAFHQRTRKVIDEYAHRRVPFSCNNGVRVWTPIQLVFDWAFGELSFSRAKPEILYEAMRTATEHGRIQVVTMPKKGDRNDLPGWERLTRQTIATAYACGGLCMVPWDVYMPHDAPRYFGSPEQYADLFGFIRANSAYLNGYEEAAVTGKGLKEDRYATDPPVILEGGSGEVRAFVRARPGDKDAPVVIHLIEWDRQSRPATVKLRGVHFFGDRRLSARLILPAPYDMTAHIAAERTRDYAALVTTVSPSPTTKDGCTAVEIPALDPWGILVVSPPD